MSSDIPPGWKLEKVSPPEQFKLPASELYRRNWEKIFGAKPASEPANEEGKDNAAPADGDS